MVDAVNSGYKEEAQTVGDNGTQPISSLVNDEWSDLTDEIDNSSVKYLFADFDLSVTFGTTAATQGETISLYLVPSVDGTNYPDWVGGAAVDEAQNEQYFVGSFTVDAGTSAQRHALRGVSLPPGKFKLGARNNAATGDITAATLKYRRWGYASA